MNEVLEQPEVQENTVQEVTLSHAEMLKTLSQEELEKRFDEGVSGLPTKKWVVPFTREDNQFITHLLSMVPFKGLEAYMLVDIRNNIGEQQKEITIDSPTLEALWKVVVTKYEGKGIKEAQKYVSASNKLAIVVQELQNTQKHLQEMGYELETREAEAFAAQAKEEVVHVVEEKKPKKSKLKLEK